MNLLGNPSDFFVAFAGGVLVSFTPCIYPLIPVTAGYIGARGSTSRLKGLGLSLVYVSGVAVTYAALGLLASFTGTIFGAISVNPATSIIVGIIIILFGLSMLDLFAINLPNTIKLPKLKKENYLSTFLLGLVSGLAVSPCLTPVLGSILAYLATKKNLLYGALLLFSFGYGMGIVLIIVGTFSALFISMPRPNKWMSYIKKGLAFILVAMGAYFIYTGIRRI